MTTSHPNNNSGFIEETDADRRRGVLADTALSLDLVSAYAGDRVLTDAEKAYLVALENSRGLRFFSDLLYSITHQYFAPKVAEALWVDVLKHKHMLSQVLERNAGIVVATLDYLSNITSNMDAATLVGEVHIGEIIGLSLRDGLTGLFNHTYFYQQIDFEVKRYVRYDTSVTLALIDIDDFKAVNDTYGHREGDRILSVMGKTLLRLARDSDICCRYGGEEFAVILPLTSTREISAITNRMRKALAQVLPNGQRVTVSIGVATCGEKTKTYQQLVEKADAALYRGKKSGKNCIEVATDEDE
ncbi:GGDEF domain-containing protein [Pseudomonadota bacterium]